MKNSRKYQWICAVLMTVMLLVPATPAWSDDARESNIVQHISALSDGKKEKTISFAQPGTDKTTAIKIPNGASIVSARMNVTSLPYTAGGDDYPENVTVDFGNDGTPEWAFKGKSYGQMGHQTMFSDSNTSFKVGLPGNGGINASATVRLPKNANITSAKMDVKGSIAKILIVCADGLPTYINDVVTDLLAFKNEISVVDSFDASNGTPTLSLLKNYTACYLYALSHNYWVDGANFKDRTALGNVMADYVDAGGGVVTASMVWYTTSNLQGRWLNAYSGVSIISGMSAGGAMSLGTKALPDHPILRDVNSIVFSEGMWTSSGTPVNNGQIAFYWGTSTWGGIVMTMPNGANRVDLQMNPYSDTLGARGSYTKGYTGDGDDLIKNSLLWTQSGNIIMPGNFSLDFANDGHIDWTNPNLDKIETVPDFSSQLNSYLATAQPNGTDDYGNEYVDVPIGATSNASGLLTLSNMSIIYTLTSPVGVNPATGDLASALAALVPTKYDMKSSNITIAVFSNHAGKVKLSDISIDYTIDHPPIIQTRTPEESTVFMNENETIEFKISAWDPYDFPMCVTWLMKNKVYLTDMYNMSWHADFEANGTYNVSVSVDNGLQKVGTFWSLVVKNVNRKPVIDSFSPDKKFEMDENSSAIFELSASDPDKDAVTYDWYVDGRPVTSEEPSYEYKTTYFSAGKHMVKATVWDSVGASTDMAWNVTVNNVNAAPQITDSSPMVDEVPMNENSTKKFTVTDLAIDGDKQVISWYVDGNSTGATGKSYVYSADYNSAGRHEVAAEVSDGKLTARRTWYVNVADVNRPPTAVISAPAAGAEFMVGDDITLDGTQSSDPDGDQLSMNWSESGKLLGTGKTLTVNLAKGRHLIALGVDDGKKNGNASATLQITVRYLDFGGKLTVDAETPVEGTNIRLAAVLTNRGDGSIDELLVSFSVDGTELSTTTIESIEPSIDFPLEFQWKAVRGNHTLEVSVNNQNFSKMVTVAKKPASASSGGDLLIPMLAITIVVVVAAVAGFAVFAGRKKRAAAPPAKKTKAPEEPGAAIPYTSAGTVAAAPAPAAAMTDDAKALEAIENTERILTDSENAGLDTAKARQSLKIARNFFEMGKYQKAMLYCQNAENSIE